MTSLADIFSAPATCVVPFNGKQVTLTELSSEETALIYTVFPEPVAPMKPTPGVAMNAPGGFTPDTTDAGYVAAHMDWSRRRNVVEIAVAIGFKTSGGLSKVMEPTAFKLWADQAFSDLTKMPNRLILQLLDAINSIGGDAKGFSSAPQSQGPSQPATSPPITP